MSWTGRVMDDHEAFLYLHHGGCGYCVYVYITQDGQVLQFDGEKLADCLIQRDGYLRADGLEAQERLSINGRPDVQQEYMKSRQRIMALQDEIQQELEKLERAFVANRMQMQPISMKQYAGDIVLAKRMEEQGKKLGKILEGSQRDGV